MRNYNVLYSDKSFRLETSLDNDHCTTLRLTDSSEEHGAVQILFHHMPEDADRMHIAMKSAADAFNSTWKYFHNETTRISADDEAPITEIKVIF
jgi:hypothetical protein